MSPDQVTSLSSVLCFARPKKRCVLKFQVHTPISDRRKLLLLTVLVLWWASREVGWLLSRGRGRTPRWSTARKAWWCECV